ncbi:MAG: T9SS type A sorting domain-containing protein [Chitinophagales bacterium]
MFKESSFQTNFILLLDFERKMWGVASFIDVYEIGTHEVMVTDENGCVATASVTTSGYFPPNEIPIIEKTNEECTDVGEAHLTITNNTISYRIWEWKKDGISIDIEGEESPVEIIHGKPITNPTPGQAFPGLNKLQQAFWQMMDGNCDRDCANQLLTAQNEEWSKRILVASYLNQGDFTTANNLLATLPTHDTQALQFYNIMDMLLNYPLDATTESNLTGLAANQNDRYIATLAESALTIYFGHRFTRNAHPISLNGGGNKRGTEILESKYMNAIQMNMLPNPAKNYVNIYLDRAIAKTPLSFSIYDASGVLVKSVTIDDSSTSFTVNTSELSSGVYFCRLYNDNFIYQHQKLVVLH